MWNQHIDRWLDRLSKIGRLVADIVKLCSFMD